MKYRIVVNPAALLLAGGLAMFTLAGAAAVQLHAETPALTTSACSNKICTSDQDCIGVCACQTDTPPDPTRCSTILQ